MENLKQFIGLTLTQAVQKVQSEKDFIAEFAVATEKNSDIILKVEEGAYHLIVGTKDMDEYIIETNSSKNRNFWIKTENGFHKIISRNWVKTGYYFSGQQEEMPTIKREI